MRRMVRHGDTPVGDEPQFDTDGSGLLFATGPSGTHAPLEASELVSPAMNLSGCEGRTTSLSFWHWVQFGRFGGGWVEVWNGQQWVRVEPVRGYGGPVLAAALHGLGRPAGFVTPAGESSGWRFEVFDVTAHVNAAFRVRFRFFGDLLPQPGWYVDTVAVSTDALEDLPRLDGDPNLPGCGFGAPAYDAPKFNEVVPDPCVAGTPIVESRTVWLGDPKPPNGQEPPQLASAGPTTSLVPMGMGAAGWETRSSRGSGRGIGLDGRAADGSMLGGRVEVPVEPLGGSDIQVGSLERVEFTAPGKGAICVVIYNGSADRATRVVFGSVHLDGNDVISAQRFNADHTLLRERQPVEAGDHVLEIDTQGAPSIGQPDTDVAPGPGSFYTYQVMFQPGDAMPRGVPADPNDPGGGGSLPNLVMGHAPKLFGGKVEVITKVPAVAPGPQGYVVRYVVQLADPRSCRQLREIRGAHPVPVDGDPAGWVEAIAMPGFGWDGRDDQGRPVQGSRLFARVTADIRPLGLPLFPSPDEMVPRGGGDPPFLLPHRIDVAAGGPVIEVIRTPARLLKEFRRLITPGLWYIADSGACGRLPGADTATAPDCAPSASWTVGVPRFAHPRTIRILGSFAPTAPVVGPNRWRVEFRLPAGGTVL
ncbi:MAG: hypothetical protein ABIJ75_06560, partial [Actinomycetota bacterium]